MITEDRVLLSDRSREAERNMGIKPRHQGRSGLVGVQS
jgi:hypothetical protein